MTTTTAPGKPREVPDASAFPAPIALGGPSPLLPEPIPVTIER